MNKKILVTGIVVLFIGLALAPSIHANISKERELVEITTEVCGLSGMKPQTVQLTQEEAEAVDKLFDEIKNKLDAVETREEAVEIFNEAIEELDKYGLLGGLSVEQAQRIVTSFYQNPKIINILEKLNPRPLDENLNAFCLIAGKTDNTFVEGHVFRIAMYLMQFENIPEEGVIIFYILSYMFTRFKPFVIWHRMSMGIHAWNGEYYVEKPANGWVSTIGLNGVKTWGDKIFGQFSNLLVTFLFDYYYPGVIGFTGFKFQYGYGVAPVAHYLGNALLVKLGSTAPD